MEQERQETQLSIIENISMTQVSGTLQKIYQFQQLVNSQLKKDHDYGVIPHTQKPTLLKPGAEKILMLMGITSEFEIADSTRDWEKGFFQYQVRCKLFKNGLLLTEGLGAANTKETKFEKANPFSIDNTILKMAKKRALVDATLLVGSLSDVFTQDMEDLTDMSGAVVPDKPIQHIAPDSTDTISPAQAKRMYAISKGNADLCKAIIKAHGYEKSEQVRRVDYDKICKEIEDEISAGSAQ